LGQKPFQSLGIAEEGGSKVMVWGGAGMYVAVLSMPSKMKNRGARVEKKINYAKSLSNLIILRTKKIKYFTGHAFM
jgi:hypothetical protein